MARTYAPAAAPAPALPPELTAPLPAFALVPPLFAAPPAFPLAPAALLAPPEAMSAVLEPQPASHTLITMPTSELALMSQWLA